jgi:hypothetical protein
MPVKAPVKKTTKNAQKPVKKAVKKTSKKITWDDIEAGFDRLQKLHEETERTLNKTIGGLNAFGSIVEHILTSELLKKFKKLGYSFNNIAIYKFAEGVWAQIDGMLENGTQAVVVEVKTTLQKADIDDHVNRMKNIRKFADEHGDKRQFMGALASIIIADDLNKGYALKKGLFVIEPSGEDVKVIKPDTEPRIW